MAEFAQAAAVNPRGALISAEAYWCHRHANRRIIERLRYNVVLGNTQPLSASFLDEHTLSRQGSDLGVG